MAYFPVNIMPKSLKRETVNEVDNSPNIFNARDYNIHHREILALEKFLVGNGIGSGDQGLLDVLTRELQIFRDLSNNGLISQFCGQMKSGETINLSGRGQFFQTHIVSLTTAGATEIEVDSVAGFPSSGYITKFNSMNKTVSGSPEKVGYNFGSSITSQEIISYTGIVPEDGSNPAKFTGCIRALEGTTDQEAAADDAAVIFGGKASLMLGLRSLKANAGKIPNQVFVSHDSKLFVTAAAYEDKPTLTPIDSLLEISYALSIVGTFEDIRISQFLG